MYSSDEQPRTEVNAVIGDVPNITTEERKKSLKGMKRKKIPGEDVISIDS